jgi:folate-binding protein YgfZ
MQNEWQMFLSEQGGKTNEKGHIVFSQSTLDELALVQSNCLLSSLDQLGVIHVTGADAQTFLQGQFSNDINLLDHSSSQISAYCNPKGRMLAQFIVIPGDDGYFLVSHSSVLDKTIMRLRMFVLRSQVTLTDVSQDIVCFGLIGDNISVDLDLPTDNFALTKTEQIFCSKIPSCPARYLVLAPVDAARDFWLGCSDHCPMVSSHIWNWLDIQAGIPSIQQETVEEFVPQMLNLELVGGVNFKKGCYPGQEIVARMHYLGKPKRRMFKLHAETEQTPLPGENLYIHGGDGQSAGKVVIAEPSIEKGTDLLAVIRLNHADSQDLRLGSEDGPPLVFRPLPYDLETE